MKTVILLIVFLAMTYSSFAQWTEQTNPSNKKLHGVNFLNTSTGFACGDTGTVMTSINAGVTWTNINPGIPANINMTEVQFLNTTIGYCSGGLGSLSGKVYKTVNGGSNWTLVFDTTNMAVRDIFFINPITGWAAGNTTVKYTSNSGTSWVSRGFNGSSNTCVLALSPDTVFVSGFGSAGYIVKSVNGGINWSFTTVPANLADFRFVFFANSFTGYAGGLALGGLGGMAKTTDRGLTWTQLLSYVGSTPTDCYFMNESTGYVVNFSELQLTTDGGITWSNQVIPSAGEFENIALVPPFGCIVGRKIATLSTIGIQQISSEAPNDFSLKQNYPNPFNPVTNIEFSVPIDVSHLRLVVFDITGREIAVLVDQALRAGTYKIDFDGSEYASGVYFYRIQSPSFTDIKKMSLIK